MTASGAVNTTHPDITQARLAEWRDVIAAAQGEAFIKQAGQTFLPKPSGFLSQPDQGEAAYAAYTARAQFPEMFEPTVSAMVGLIHDKKIRIEMPEAMEGIVGVSSRGELKAQVGIRDFHRTITRGLLTQGRYAVAPEAPEDNGDVYLAGYAGNVVINWDQDFFVIDETAYVRSGYTWNLTPRYRVLYLQDGAYTQDLYQENAAGEIVRVMGQSETGSPVWPKTITGTGGSRLDYVPLVIGNSKQVTPDLMTPPLYGVATAAIAYYQLSADQRLQLFMSGQETLVAINGAAPDFVGAGVVHQMSGTETLTPDLKYVSPTCAGIAAHDVAMDKAKQQAALAGARLLFPEGGGAQESGEARKLRFTSETANILTIASTSCMILESALRAAAEMQGLNPEDVSVEPPTDLMDRTITPAEAKTLWEIYEGGGMSFETYWSNLQKGGLAPSNVDADEELGRVDDPTDDGLSGQPADGGQSN